MNSITIHCERLPDGRLQIYGDDFPDTFKDEPGCDISSASRDHAIFKLGAFLQEQLPEEVHWVPGWDGIDDLHSWADTDTETVFPHRSGD